MHHGSPKVASAGQDLRGVSKQEPTEANSRLRMFPKEIPGAKDVRKYEIPGAAYCLVHVRSAHACSHPQVSGHRCAEAVRKDVHDILSYLRDHHDLREVYLEGVTHELARQLNTPGNLENVVRGPAGDQVTAAMSGVAEFGLDGSVRINAGSTLVGELLAEQEILGGRPPGLATLDNREDILLNLLYDKDTQLHLEHPSVFVVVYGGLHAFGGSTSCGDSYSPVARRSFKDNIAWWNDWHSNKFSLIEITPISYE